MRPYSPFSKKHAFCKKAKGTAKTFFRTNEKYLGILSFGGNAALKGMRASFSRPQATVTFVKQGVSPVASL